MTGFRAQGAKVQRPLVREDTLTRDRLLDWLHAKIHHRVVLVIAEAGYGKTTLLADFSRHTRLRTLWYRLDETDANWVAFLGHLVAAGREIDPEFAAATHSLLSEIGIAGPPRDAVIETFAREIAGLGERGAVIVLDDYHAVEDSDDVRTIMRRLLAVAPERVTFVLSSRRPPALPLARARAQGEVAELGTDDLRFDAAETERLFRETYGHPLEPDVLAELSRRTEGWAASLQLVRAAIQDRSAYEVHSLVDALTGARAEIFDYLAEEIVGELPADLQTFVMRAALLPEIDVDGTAAAAGIARTDAIRYLEAAESVGVLPRKPARRGDRRRLHPLVQEFLLERLRTEIGEAAVVDLRMALGRAATDWVTAVHHFREAGDLEAVRDVVTGALDTIMGTGQDALAGELLELVGDQDQSAAAEILRSRTAIRRGDLSSARVHALRARAISPSDPMALMNDMSTAYTSGDLARAVIIAEEIVGTTRGPMFRAMAQVLATGIKTSLDYNLADWRRDLENLAREQEAKGHRHFQGVAMLNAANVLRAQGLAVACLTTSQRAVTLLSSTSAGVEVASALLTKAWALGHLGRIAEARTEMAEARQRLSDSNAAEILSECADIELWYGDPATAEQLLDRASGAVGNQGFSESLLASRTEAALARCDIPEAVRLLSEMRIGEPSLTAGLQARQLALSARLAVTLRAEGAGGAIDGAMKHAQRQTADFWVSYLEVLDLVRRPPAVFNGGVRDLSPDRHAFLSVLAELVADRLPDLDTDCLPLVEAEAASRPERWRPVFRRLLDSSGSPKSLIAARLLDRIGDATDVPRLRATVRRRKGLTPGDRALGYSLARRLAPRVVVMDLGRVSISVGATSTPGSGIRRKVLGLLCYLVSRPGYSAAREEVVDALWPELDPSVALNSLNQTVYFMRRVFEPEYAEDVSPGYVHHDSDILWLDRELVSAASTTCSDLIVRAIDSHDPSIVEQLSEHYAGRFALDFMYEEWAAPLRDRLHAGYLHAVEEAVQRDIVTGNFDRGIRLARRALELDPDAEHIELSLLKLYRLVGAHAAAAEQYGHYSAVLRDDLGIEPPPLDTI